jgi:hypothetical protein
VGTPTVLGLILAVLFFYLPVIKEISIKEFGGVECCHKVHINFTMFLIVGTGAMSAL